MTRARDVLTAGPRRRPLRGASVARLVVALCAVAVVIVIAGCGGSKPEYCSNRSSLEKTVKSIPSMVTSKDVSGLQSVGTTLQSEANKTVSSAKSDFPQQTSAIKSSVEALESAIKAMPSSPTASDYANLAVTAASAVSSVSDFVSATNSKC